MPQQPDEPVKLQSTSKSVGIADAFARLGDTLNRSATQRGTAASAANRRQLEALGALGLVVGLNEANDERRASARGGKVIDAVVGMGARRRGPALAYVAAPCGEAD